MGRTKPPKPLRAPIDTRAMHHVVATMSHPSYRGRGAVEGPMSTLRHVRVGAWELAPQGVSPAAAPAGLPDTVAEGSPRVEAIPRGDRLVAMWRAGPVEARTCAMAARAATRHTSPG